MKNRLNIFGRKMNAAFLRAKARSGKSTTEKLICGLLVPSGGSIRLFDRDYTDPDVRAKMDVLIEASGCFPNLTVWDNMMLQAANLHIQNAGTEVRKVLRTVRMEGATGNKYKNCSLGMKQRVGIAMALLGEPALLVLDEPINGLDTESPMFPVLSTKHFLYACIFSDIRI